MLHTGYPAITHGYQKKERRLSSVNDMLLLLLMAAKFNVLLRPYGALLGEYVQHLAMVDYIYISGSLEHRVLEYTDDLQAHFRVPAVVKDGHYQVPLTPGYNVEMKKHSLVQYSYPHGHAWKND